MSPGASVGGGEAGVRARAGRRAAAAARARRPVAPRLTAAHLQLHHRQAVHQEEVAIVHPALHFYT